MGKKDARIRMSERAPDETSCDTGQTGVTDHMPEPQWLSQSRNLVAGILQGIWVFYQQDPCLHSLHPNRLLTSSLSPSQRHPFSCTCTTTTTTTDTTTPARQSVPGNSHRGTPGDTVCICWHLKHESIQDRLAIHRNRGRIVRLPTLDVFTQVDLPITASACVSGTSQSLLDGEVSVSSHVGDYDAVSHTCHCHPIDTLFGSRGLTEPFYTRVLCPVCVPSVE